MWTPERIKALRKRTGQGQTAFAARFRVSVDALRHWEQGRGFPSGPVEILLELLENDLNAFGAPAPDHPPEPVPA